jgi:hypothetical protein
VSKLFRGYDWKNIFFLFSLREILLNFSFVELPYPLLAQAIVAGFIILCVFPLRISGVLSLTLWTLWMALIGSLGPPVHSEHGYFLVSLACALTEVLNLKQSDADFEWALAGCTYIYTASGLWKLFSLTREDHFFQAAAENLPQHIAYGLAENFRDQGIEFLDYFYHHPVASALLWCLVILTQVLVPLGIIFFKRWRIFFLLTLILFHLGGKWIVGPSFTAQIYLLAMFIGIILYRHVRPLKELRRREKKKMRA